MISKEKYQQVTRPLSAEDIDLKKAEVSKMEFELDKLSRKYASRQARSEREGYVLEVLKDRGDRVKEADVILNLVDLSRPFIVDGMVFESEVSSLKKGQTAFIKIPGFKDPFKAELSEISLVARPMGNMKKFPIKLVLHEKMEGTIRLGVSAHFDIVIGEAKQVPVLPIQFIEEKDRIKGVWKDAGSKLQFIPIQLGLSDTSFVEIKEGLEPGDAVVLPSTQKAAP